MNRQSDAGRHGAPAAIDAFARSRVRAAAASRARRRSQGGWVGMVVLLLALLVVAWLAKDALTSYGLMGPATATKAGAPGERARVPAAVDASGSTAEPEAPAPAPTAPMDRARAAGDVLKQQEGQRGGGH